MTVVTLYETTDGTKFRNRQHANQHEDRLFARWCEDDLPKITMAQFQPLLAYNEHEDMLMCTGTESEIFIEIVRQVYDRTVESVPLLHAFDYNTDQE